MKGKFALMTLALAVLTCTIGVAGAQDARRYDDDDYRYHRDYDRNDRGDYRHDYGEGPRIAYNPYPRGHNHADRGYRYEFGSLQDYRGHYAQAYHEGYQSAYEGDYGHGYYR